MRRNRLLHILMAGLTLVVALMSSGLADLSSSAAVYAQGLAAAQARRIPPKGPDLGRFTPTIHVPQKAPTTWKPAKSVSVAPKAKQAPQGGAPSGSGPAKGRTPGEQPDLRTAASSTILNADGTWTRLTYAVPIHYQDATGAWQNIDTTITADSSDPGYAFTNAANSWHIHFAQQSGGTQFVHAKFAQTEYFETITNAASVRAAPHGSQITYPNIFPNVDAVYTIMHAHIEETLLLHSASVPASFTLSYHVPGATAQQDQGGNIVFTDAKGVVVLVIDAPVMFEADSQGQMAPAAAGSDHIAMALTGNGPDYAVTLTPDAQWLADPARKYPVAIDPTYSSSDPHTNTSNGNIYADTFNESANPTTLFYTTNSERVGNCSALPSGATGYGTGTNRSYLKFPAGSPPAQNARVIAANLSLYQTSAYAGATQINAEEIQSSWNATTLDWNNRPTGLPMKGHATTNTTYDTTLTIDVTAIVYDWWEGGVANNGISLRFNNESVACDFFASDDYGSHLPSLGISWANPDATAPVAGVSVTAQNPYTANGTTYTNSTNAQVSSTFSDPGATTAFTSNWATVNGVSANGGVAPSWTASGGELTADTSTCGSTSCPVETFFTSTVSDMTTYPTFTTMFQSDLGGAFNFGVVQSGNRSTRFDLVAPAGGSAFTTAEVSTSLGSYSAQSVNIPFSPNTWYYGQVAFPAATVGQIYLWPVGQAKPSTPTYVFSGLAMSNPGLNFWEQGTNGAGTHVYTISTTLITSGSTSGTVSYGPWGLQYSNDQTTWSCPSPSGTWCIANDKVALPWTLSAGDGNKTVYVRATDNANIITALPYSNASVTLDQTPPTTSITAPAAGREVRGVVTVSGQASDPTVNSVSSGLASVALYLDGAQTGQALSGSTPSFTWDTTGVAPGPHALSFVATDNVGNTSTSAGVIVDVANTGQAQYNTYAMRDLPDGTSAGANVASGDALVIHQDLDIPSYGPDLALTRTYNSLGPINNLFGWGWTSDLDEGVIANADGSVTYRDPDGGLHIFLPNGSGGYLSSPGLNLTLIKNTDGTYTLTARDQSKTNFNSAGYLTSLVDRNGNTVTITYIGSTSMTVTDASGRTLEVTLTGGHITQIVDPLSHTYTYTYDGSGNLTGYTNPSGVNTLYGYDSAHHLNQVTANCTTCVAGDPAGATDWETNVTTTLTYDSLGRLVKIVDPLGYDADFSYGVGQPGTLQTQVAQLQTNQNTNPPTTNSEYETTTYTLANDGSGAVTAIQDPLGGQIQYQYDSNERVTQTTDADGNVSTSVYDANGNELTHVTDPGGQALTTTRTYDSANNVTTQTDPDGVITKYNYDSPATGNLTQVVTNYVSGGPTNADTNVTTTFTYDAHGQQLTATDSLGIVTKYTYDSQGDETATTRNFVSGGPTDAQTNVTTSTTYDVLGREVTATDAEGIVTRTTYDARGDVTQVVDNYRSDLPPDSSTNITTQYSYDALGRQVTTTDPLGVVTKTIYDADGREIQSMQNYISGGPTDAQTNVTTTTSYDAAGNATIETDPAGNKTVTTFDLSNQGTRVQAQTSSGVVVSDTKTTYSGSSNKATTQTVNGGANPTTTYTYDSASRTKTQQDPPASLGAGGASGTSNITTYTYSTAGNVVEIKVTNAALSSPISDATSTYDKLNRHTGQTLQVGTTAALTTAYTYDAAGQQTSVTDSANRTTTTDYDPLGRVIKVTYSDGSQEMSTYDADDRRLTLTTSAGKTTDTYDALGRLIVEQRKDPSGAVQVTVSTTYDADGHPLQQTTTDASGAQVTLTATYDKLGRLATMSDGAWTYSYDLAGNETAMTATDGSSATIHVDRGYDASGRLTSLTDSVGATGTTLHSYTYGYDANGYSSSVSADGTTTNYTYDGLGQTLTAASGASTTSYAYDANRNRTSLSVTGVGTTTYTYDAANVRLTSQTGPDGKVTTYGYDTNGNITTETYDPSGANQVTGYVYGPAGGLAEVHQPDGSKVQFTYDAEGQRVTKTVTSGGATPTTTTIKDVYAFGRVAYETDGSGTVLARFAYDMQGTPVSVQVGADPATAPRYYYVYNGHGDVVALVDALGVTVASYTYDAFGVPTSVSESFPNGWTNPYRYNGCGGQMRYDAETGLYIVGMGARAYDPTLGRYLTPDASLSYVYADNDPLGAGGSGQGVGSGAPATPATPAAGDSMYQYHICTTECGGGDLTITLGGHKYSLSEVDNPWWFASERVKFTQLFGTVYSGRSGINWLRSARDFISYLGRGKPSRIPYSPYWSGVDAEGLMHDMFMAVYNKQHGRGDSAKKSIHYWMRFISQPGPVLFWFAHNDSIALASFSSLGRHWFHQENGDERNFINAADWILFIAGAVEVGLYWSLPLLSILPVSPHAARRVVQAFLAVCGSQGVCVGLWAGWFYPRAYPAPWWWRWTPVGWLMTKVGCMLPLFRGVPCGGF